jgi:hypothetical protein
MTRVTFTCKFSAVAFCLLIAPQFVGAQAVGARVLSGVVITARGEAVPGVAVVVTSSGGEFHTASDAEGGFRLPVPGGALTLRLSGENVAAVTKEIAAGGVTRPPRASTRRPATRSA